MLLLILGHEIGMMWWLSLKGRSFKSWGMVYHIFFPCLGGPRSLCWGGGASFNLHLCLILMCKFPWQQFFSTICRMINKIHFHCYSTTACWGCLLLLNNLVYPEWYSVLHIWLPQLLLEYERLFHIPISKMVLNFWFYWTKNEFYMFGWQAGEKCKNLFLTKKEHKGIL